MLKITEAHATADGPILRLAGRVIGPWVAELRHVCERALAGGGPLTLDLREVSYVDADGAALLQELMRRHVALTNRSPFIDERLRLT